MKPILIIFLFIFSLIQLKAQDDIKDYHEPELSTGTSVIFNGDLKYNDYYNNAGSYSSFDVRDAIINTDIYASHWRLTPKISYGLFAAANGEYIYHHQKQEQHILQEALLTDDVNEISNIKGNIYAAGEYYFNNKFFTAIAYKGEIRYSSTYRYSKNLLLNTGHSDSWNGSSTFWLSGGYGKIVNTARTTKTLNFEKLLKREGVIAQPLRAEVKIKLAKLMDKRNNKDYLSKYKDDNEIIFFRDVENLLLNEGVINQRLGAETTLKLFQVLTNDKFLYYPKLHGFRTQIDLQLNPVDYGSGENFLILSGIYGFPIWDKTSGLFAAFTALPLSKEQSTYGIFSDIRNPFSNALPVTLEHFHLDNYNQDFYGTSMNDYRSDQVNITGFKLHIFHSFSSFAGIILRGQYLYSKPKNLANFSEFDAGFQVDYNILSFIKLSGNMDIKRNNRSYSSIDFSLGTSIIIY